jgi:HD-like signal output (HDOD) protein
MKHNAAIGSALMEMWKIDPSVVNSVRYHHAPEKAPLNLQSAIWATYLSEYILLIQGLVHLRV